MQPSPRPAAPLVTTVAMFAVACAIPTTYGLRTDGVLPQPGEAQVQTHGGFAFVDANDGDSSAFFGGGVNVEAPLSRRTSIELGRAIGGDGVLFGGLYGIEVRYRVSPDPDAKLSATWLGGGAMSIYPDNVTYYVDGEEVRHQIGGYAWQFGAHTGALATFNAHPVRVYAGGKVNAAAGDWFGLWPMGTVGVSLRPVHALVIGAEATYLYDRNHPALVPLFYGGVRL